MALTKVTKSTRAQLFSKDGEDPAAGQINTKIMAVISAQSHHTCNLFYAIVKDLTTRKIVCLEFV